MKIIGVYLLIFMFLTGCSLFERRDFSDQMNPLFEDSPMFSAHDDFMVVPGDTGRVYRPEKEFLARVPLSRADQLERNDKDHLRRELRILESRLTDLEFYEFDRNRQAIGSLSEQIYYLRLKKSERKEYLSLKGIDERSVVSRGPASVQNRQIEGGKNFIKGDIVTGMTTDKVLESWGAPVKREIAGNPKYRNERWAFRKNNKTKYIYFENGIVQGWSEQ